jgi:hypothetical protein
MGEGIVERECPLCGVGAGCRAMAPGDRSSFDCPRCGCFEISQRSEQVLSQSPRSWRESFSRRARQAPDGHRLAIGLPSPARHGKPVAALSGDFVRIQEHRSA